MTGAPPSKHQELSFYAIYLPNTYLEELADAFVLYRERERRNPGWRVSRQKPRRCRGALPLYIQKEIAFCVSRARLPYIYNGLTILKKS